MPIICHRINTVSELRTIPPDCGVEIDVRFDTRSSRLYLHHDNCGPGEIEKCDGLEEYLSAFQFNPNRIIVFNIKDSGSVSKKGPGKDVEWECLRLADTYGIPKSNYFLLDAEFPWIFHATQAGVEEISVRYSEAEPIEQLLYFRNNTLNQRVRWAWIDVNTKLPLDAVAVKQLAQFKTCVVCPERWGRPQDIEPYAETMRRLRFQPDAVMTNVKFVERWRSTGVVRELL